MSPRKSICARYVESRSSSRIGRTGMAQEFLLTIKRRIGKSMKARWDVNDNGDLVCVSDPRFQTITVRADYFPLSASSVVALLEYAFECGMSEKAKQIREALGA